MDGMQEAMATVWVVSMLWSIGIFVLDIVLAIFVYRDAEKLAYPALEIPAILWALATLFGSIFGVLGYWIMNRSSLRLDREAEPAKAASG